LGKHSDNETIKPIRIGIQRGDYRTDAELKACERDKRKIDRLLAECDTTSADGTEKLYGILQSGEIRFETGLGNRFDDAVYERREELKRTGAPAGKKAGGKKTAETGKKGGRSGGKEASSGRRSLEDYDPEMQKAIIAEIRKSEKRRKLLIVLAIFVTIGAFGGYYLYYKTAKDSGNQYDTYANLKGSDALSNMDRGNGMYTATIVNEEGEEVHLEVLDEYKTLFNLNRHLIGWIKIADINGSNVVIDLPVMQGSDNSYYLSHNFDEAEDKAGALFLDCNCDAVKGNDNFIIYGHHLTSGRMFSFLGNYESESYYEKYPVIRFDTIYEEGTYQVMYAFRSHVYDTNEVAFKYYQFIDAYSEEEFNSYMNEMASLSYINTGVTAHYGDRLLTLSTCDYQEENGRFVVVAKRIR